MSSSRVFDRRNLLLMLGLLLFVGFSGVALLAYYSSYQQIHNTIVETELPLTSSNVYSEIQKDLVRPVLISSTMAQDTFLRDWVLHGEKNGGEITRYLMEIRRHYGAFSSFFVSDKSGIYYTGNGMLKKVRRDEPRDAWYYRVREMEYAYEINVDVDMANADALTIFINYRVFDYDGRYIGATGVGLTADAVSRLIDDYQRRFQRTIYFVDKQGHVVQLRGGRNGMGTDLRSAPGLSGLIDGILAEKSGVRQFKVAGDQHVLNFNYLPELQWYLFVEQNESHTLAKLRRTLWLNLLISLLLTLAVLWSAHRVLNRYQQRIEEMATTDKLTRLLNRHAFEILATKLYAEQQREPRPFCVLLVDIDHFKAINDSYGHTAGDGVLQAVAQLLQGRLRSSDLAVRWGGEEFLLLLKACHANETRFMAEALRAAVVAAPIALPGADSPAIAVSISIGLACHDGTESIETLIGRADKALYAAKQAGRNCVAG